MNKCIRVALLFFLLQKGIMLVGMGGIQVVPFNYQGRNVKALPRTSLLIYDATDYMNKPIFQFPENPYDRQLVSVMVGLTAWQAHGLKRSMVFDHPHINKAIRYDPKSIKTYLYLRNTTQWYEWVRK